LFIFKSLHKERLTKKHHFQDEKYEEKIKRPVKSCEVFIPAYRQAGTGNNITKYSGLNTVAKYMNKQGIVKSMK